MIDLNIQGWLKKQIETLFATKANIIADNFTAIGKKTIVDYVTPDYSAGIDISSYATVSNQFSCPSSGIIVFNIGGTNNQTAAGYINNVAVYISNSAVAHWDSIPFIVKKGDQVFGSTQAGYGTGKFYPFKRYL